MLTCGNDAANTQPIKIKVGPIGPASPGKLPEKIEQFILNLASPAKSTVSTTLLL
jgi:hypothetical protein